MNLGGLGQASLIPYSKTSMPRIFIPRENSISRDLSLPHPGTHGRSSIPQAWKKGEAPLSLLPPFFFNSHPPQIVAIGRNYLDHIKELGNAVPSEPFFFLKPTSSYLPSQTPGAKLQIPRGVLAHHEGSFPPSLSPSRLVHKKPAVELGLVIGTPGRDISQEDALSHIAGYSQSSSPFLKPFASSYTTQPSPLT